MYQIIRCVLRCKVAGNLDCERKRTAQHRKQEFKTALHIPANRAPFVAFVHDSRCLQRTAKGGGRKQGQNAFFLQTECWIWPVAFLSAHCYSNTCMVIMAYTCLTSSETSMNIAGIHDNFYSFKSQEKQRFYRVILSQPTKRMKGIILQCTEKNQVNALLWPNSSEL